jgi:hypothetical protein
MRRKVYLLYGTSIRPGYGLRSAFLVGVTCSLLAILILPAFTPSPPTTSPATTPTGPAVGQLDNSTADIAAPGLSAYNYPAAMANLEQKYMLAASGGYQSGASRSWTQVIDGSKSFLGNTFITRGFIALYDSSRNSTYLSWARKAANSLWVNAWDKKNYGFYDNYGSNWKNTTCNQPLQENAEFVHISLDLYSRTQNSTYLSWATKTMNFIMSRFHDKSYGGMYYVWSPCSRSITDSNKYLENSLGAFAWAAMKWYGFTHNSIALKWSQESIGWMRRYLWNSSSAGYMSETDRTGKVVNHYFYPNVEVWGMTGMIEFYSQTGNATVKGWARDGLNHIQTRMWDSKYGGWYRKLNVDNTVKEDTKTGWDNCEQPWLWYNAYQKMGKNPSDLSTSALSSSWTTTHVWDGTYHGIFLEVGRNATTVLDDSKFDWVQGGCMVALSIQESPTP